MIDFHSHILPGIDDGSRSTEESVAMLQALAKQGIETVVATPHFYADETSVSAFLEQRDAAVNAIADAAASECPQWIVGAEVLYYPGISRLQGLELLKLGESKLLLLEMPVEKWTDYTVREVAEVAASPGIKVCLAHIERYLADQSDKTWDRLYESGILMQSNASFFLGFSTKRKAMRMLSDGRIHLLGSDCHNLTNRPPRIGEAYTAIGKKLGEAFVHQMCELGNHLLSH
ncbi:MAG: capsular polysaccharide biosynthesis protein [Ruminococcaceae bacterium]|nr:capsular polysaccharide biosynthesis protein [Oscillospiraceae bacterium]